MPTPPIITTIRRLLDSRAAKQIGTDGIVLLLAVADKRDRVRGDGPVPIWNKELADILDCSADTLERVRRKAVLAGWLTYEDCGRIKPGTYVVTARTDAGSLPAPVRVADRTDAGSGDDLPAPVRPVARTDAGSLPAPVRTLLPYKTPCSLKTKTPRTPRKAGGGEPDGFAEFWAAYPRKVSRSAAVRAFAKLAPDAALRAVLLAAVELQRGWPQWVKDGGQFIPHPATWLNGRRWEDEPPAAGGGAGRRRGQAQDEYAAQVLFDSLPKGPGRPMAKGEIEDEYFARMAADAIPSEVLSREHCDPPG